jgi:hypothetical protein
MNRIGTILLGVASATVASFLFLAVSGCSEAPKKAPDKMAGTMESKDSKMETKDGKMESKMDTKMEGKMESKMDTKKDDKMQTK